MRTWTCAELSVIVSGCWFDRGNYISGFHSAPSGLRFPGQPRAVMRAPGCKLARRASTSFFVAKRKDVDGRASLATTLSRHCEQPPKGARKQSRAACARDLDRFAALAMTDASLLRRTSRSTRG